MSSKVLLDTSVLVEYSKKNKTLLLDRLMEEDLVICYVTETILSEYYFQFLKLSTNQAPLSIYRNGEISNVLMKNPEHNLIYHFEYLPTNEFLLDEVPRLMVKYNLLPNDAIIFATCRMHGIERLASHDKDFLEPCKAEGIELLTED